VNAGSVFFADFISEFGLWWFSVRLLLTLGGAFLFGRPGSTFCTFVRVCVCVCVSSG